EERAMCSGMQVLLGQVDDTRVIPRPGTGSRGEFGGRRLPFVAARTPASQDQQIKVALQKESAPPPGAEPRHNKRWVGPRPHGGAKSEQEEATRVGDLADSSRKQVLIVERVAACASDVTSDHDALPGETLHDLPDAVVRPTGDERVQLSDGVFGVTRGEYGEHLAVGGRRHDAEGLLELHHTIVHLIAE